MSVPASPPIKRPTERVVVPPALKVMNSVAEVLAPETRMFPPAVTVEVAQPRTSNERSVPGDVPFSSTSPAVATTSTPISRMPLRCARFDWLASPLRITSPESDLITALAPSAPSQIPYWLFEDVLPAFWRASNRIVPAAEVIWTPEST